MKSFYFAFQLRIRYILRKCFNCIRILIFQTIGQIYWCWSSPPYFLMSLELCMKSTLIETTAEVRPPTRKDWRWCGHINFLLVIPLQSNSQHNVQFLIISNGLEFGSKGQLDLLIFNAILSNGYVFIVGSENSLIAVPLRECGLQ